MASKMRAKGANSRPFAAVVCSSAIPSALSPEMPPTRKIHRTGAAIDPTMYRLIPLAK